MSITPRSFVKDPDATLDYLFDWTAWLEGDTIADYDVSASDDTLTVDDATEAAGIVTYWLSGGVHGSNVRVTCRVTTGEGRIDDRTVTIRVRQR